MAVIYWLEIFMEGIFVPWCSHRIVGLQWEWIFTFTCAESFGLTQCKIRLVEVSRRMYFCVPGSRELQEAECVDRPSFFESQSWLYFCFVTKKLLEMFYVNDCIFSTILLHVTYWTKNPIIWECLEQLLILLEAESKKLIKRNSRHSFKTEQIFLGNFWNMII